MHLTRLPRVGIACLVVALLSSLLVGLAVAPSSARHHRSWPTERSTGVPRGWVPRRTVNGTLEVRRAGAVVTDVRVFGDIVVSAPNVTLRRVEVIGGQIQNLAGGRCNNGLRIIRSTIRRGSVTADTDEPSVTTGGYTARRVELLDVAEGFRVGGRYDGCGPVRIVNSYVRVRSPDVCHDWHGDGIQGYDGPKLTVRNTMVVMLMRPDCGGTAPFFYPADQGNTSVDIDRLMVQGGGYPFRLGMPGRVRGLRVVRHSWVFGPIDVRCSVLSSWSASVVELRHGGARTKFVRRLPCNTDSGN